MATLRGRSTDDGGASITLAPEPRAAMVARTWVDEACRALGRDELIDCARLAVSEVVTNAVLHAAPPLVLSHVGGAAQPRFQVSDGSTAPPRPNPAMTHDDALWSTIGRGLGLVASCSAAWGVRIHSHGKTVWFQPLAEPRERVDFTTAVIEYDGEPAGSGHEESVEVVIEGISAHAVREFSRHYGALIREIRLIALTDPGADPALSETARQCAAHARASVLYRDPAFRDLMTTTAESIDITLRVTPDALHTARDLHAALARLDTLLDRGALEGLDLLVETSTAEHRAFRDSFFGAFLEHPAAVRP